MFTQHPSMGFDAVPDELVEWLEEVGQVKLMDDLHATAQVEKLWG